MAIHIPGKGSITFHYSAYEEDIRKLKKLDEKVGHMKRDMETIRATKVILRAIYIQNRGFGVK
jgi:hypothetical protein